MQSHWHPDQTLGKQEYRAACPGVAILDTAATRDGHVERLPGYLDQGRAFAGSDSLPRECLASGRYPDRSPLSDGQRVMRRLMTRG